MSCIQHNISISFQFQEYTFMTIYWLTQYFIRENIIKSIVSEQLKSIKTNIQHMSDTKQLNQKIQEYNKQIDLLRFKGIKNRVLKADVQIQRLINEKFYNPYDVLQLDATATDEQIKKQFKSFSIVLHPDKCKDPRAKDAWHVVQQAHKTLLDGEKKKVYLRIMREGKERAEFQREKQNKKRIRNGQQPLPEQTFQEQYQQTCLNIFKDLEKKKDHVIKLQQSTFNRKVEEMETKKMVEQYKIQTQQQWQRSRDKRVSNWRDFSKKKFVVGSKKSNGAIRPPPIKAESRPHYTTIEDKKKNI